MNAAVVTAPPHALHPQQAILMVKVARLGSLTESRANPNAVFYASENRFKPNTAPHKPQPFSVRLLVRSHSLAANASARFSWLWLSASQVKSIAEMGAYVSLLEYNGIEGMILLSELSRRRIRSITKLIKVSVLSPHRPWPLPPPLIALNKFSLSHQLCDIQSHAGSPAVGQ